MKVLVPIDRTEFASLSSYGINQSSYPTWSSTTTYSAGDRVRRNESEYEAIATSTGVDPETVMEAPVWIRLGAINWLKAFDKTIYDQAVGNGSDGFFSYTITANKTVSAIAVFNVAATKVTALVRSSDGSEVYQTVEVELVDDAQVNNWYDYFFLPINAMNEAIIDGLIGYSGSQIVVRFYGPTTNPPRVGQLVVGADYEIGTMNEGTTVGINDYSRKERDEWGNPIIVERPFSQRAEYDIAVPTNEVRSIQRMLSSIRAKPAVFYESGTVKMATSVYGYYTNFSVNLIVGGISQMTLEVEGLV